AELTADCAQAGLADCAAYLIKASGLKDRETVRAALDRAKAVRSVCLVAKMPDEAKTLIEEGLDADGARLRLYDKIVARSNQVEIDNRVPTDDLPQNKAYQPPAPSDVYAKRRLNASKG
ncbi:Clp protease ClpP, partial [Pseudomonas aeruginosa]